MRVAERCGTTGGVWRVSQGCDDAEQEVGRHCASMLEAVHEKRRHKELGVVEGHQRSMASYVTCTMAKGQEQRATMRFVLSLTVRRSQAADKSKNIREWSLAEAEAGLRGTKTLCEYLSWERPWTKPYFDTESYHDARPCEEALEAIKDGSLASVDRVMEDQEGYARSAVRVGQRHGVDPKHDERYKVSFRMWVLGFKVEYPQLGELIKTKGVGGDGEGRLDQSVYKGLEQLMN